MITDTITISRATKSPAAKIRISHPYKNLVFIAFLPGGPTVDTPAVGRLHTRKHCKQSQPDSDDEYVAEEMDKDEEATSNKHHRGTRASPVVIEVEDDALVRILILPLSLLPCLCSISLI